MHLVLELFTVLGAWLILAVPVALFVGRFLRVGNGPRGTGARQLPHDSLDSSAA